jgi:hypothetical protein
MERTEIYTLQFPANPPQFSAKPPQLPTNPLSSQPTPSVPSQPLSSQPTPSVPSQPCQFPANPRSEWLWLQGIHLAGCFYSPFPPPPPPKRPGVVLYDGKRATTVCSKTGLPLPTSTWGQETVSSTGSSTTSTPTHCQLAACPTPCHRTEEHVARGIAAKLVYRTVGGKVETSLYCSTAMPAAEAASIIPK